MKAGTNVTFRLHTLLLPLLGLFACASTMPAWAQSTQWPTSNWVVMEQPRKNTSTLDSPVGERAQLANKHQSMLIAGSKWFQKLGFPAPLQRSEENALELKPGERYLALLKADSSEQGSSHFGDGEMWVTSHPGFLSADTPLWRLMEASAIHELYHGIQKAQSPSLLAKTQAWKEAKRPNLPECPKSNELSWLVEGTAAMVQIRWLERNGARPYGHPFRGSQRAAWVRHFDQPLHSGSVAQKPQVTVDNSLRRVSWSCSYGTWYFWYAVGDMIGRTDAEKVAYTSYLFTGPRAWGNSGIGPVDLGLKEAAKAYEAIAPYRNGLYDLYPQFVAQYLTEDRFYAHLEKIDLGTPGLYETTSSLSGGPLGPLASRAWRFRVQLPKDASPAPYNVRFTLDAPAGTDLDSLHLIVDDHLYPQNPDPTIAYSAVKRTDQATPRNDGSIEYLVRVANVARVPGTTPDVEFSLRVEVDGFYGSNVSGGPSTGEIDAISGELPPGFAVRGPGPWRCSGNAMSRAIFDLVTPDERGRDIDRMLPGLANDASNQMDDLEVMLKRMEQHGAPMGGMTPEKLAAIRKQSEAALAIARTKMQPRAAAAADEARAARFSTLAATFVGRNGNDECQMILGATLAGREGGAQIIPRAVDDEHSTDGAPAFDVAVYPAQALRAMRSLGRSSGPLKIPHTDPQDGWKVCSMTDAERREVERDAARDGCPAITCTAGRLTLEEARQGRIAGTFQFEVIRWGDEKFSQCRTPLGRDKVVGHFNVTSTDDGYDDNSLGGLGAGLSGGFMTTPGAPILSVGDGR